MILDPGFSRFQETLDAEMKRLGGTGQYKKQQAEVISVEHGDILWAKGILGDGSPQVLLDTLVFYIGLYFAICGGEHREVKHNLSQLQNSGSTLYLVFQTLTREVCFIERRAGYASCKCFVSRVLFGTPI